VFTVPVDPSRLSMRHQPAQQRVQNPLFFLQGKLETRT
jgi:hypothetical protein